MNPQHFQMLYFNWDYVRDALGTDSARGNEIGAFAIQANDAG